MSDPRLFDFKPENCRKFVTLAPNAKLPLECDMDDWGRIDDAAGEFICHVDAATPEDRLRLANIMVTAVNTCAGYAAVDDGKGAFSWRAVWP